MLTRANMCPRDAAYHCGAEATPVLPIGPKTSVSSPSSGVTQAGLSLVLTSWEVASTALDPYQHPCPHCRWAHDGRSLLTVFSRTPTKALPHQGNSYSLMGVGAPNSLISLNLSVIVIKSMQNIHFGLLSLLL